MTLTDKQFVAPSPAESRQWRCFHCDEVLLTDVDASHHFGGAHTSEPACQIKVAGEFALLHALRNAEDKLARYRSEDSDVLRVLWSTRADHAAALTREEEKGYARGLEDAKKHPETLGLQRAATPPNDDLRWKDGLPYAANGVLLTYDQIAERLRAPSTKASAPPSVTSLCSRTALDAFLTQYWPQLELRERDDLTKEAAPPADGYFAIGESVRVGPFHNGEYSKVMTITGAQYYCDDEFGPYSPPVLVRAPSTKVDVLENIAGKPACPSCGWVAGHADYCGRSTVETSCSHCHEERQAGNRSCHYCGREWLSEEASR